MIDHDAKPAFGLENPPRFPDALRRVGTVMHYAIRIHEVESVVWKRQVLGVGETQIGFVAGCFATSLCLFQRGARKFHAGSLRSSLQPFQIIGTHTDSDLKHSLS